MKTRISGSRVNLDFTDVMKFLAGKQIVSDSLTPSLVSAARKLHEATYSLVLWPFRLNRLRESGKVFIQELASDALQILPQALMGYNKTTILLNRGLIENVLRHLYFIDHPVEFKRLHGTKKWYMPISELREYLATHPLFEETEGKFGAAGTLKRLYAELSEGVHGSRVENLEMRIALEKIVLTPSTFNLRVKQVLQTAESVNFLLAVYHNAQFCKFNLEDRRIILHTMGRKAKKTLTELN